MLQAISEGIGVVNVFRQIFAEDRNTILNANATTCKGMLLREGAGKLKFMNTKQLWAQGASKTYGVEVQKVPRPWKRRTQWRSQSYEKGWGTTPKEWLERP